MTNNLIFQQQWRCIELGRNVTHSNLYMISYIEQHIGRPVCCSMPRNEEMPFSLFTVGFSPFFPFFLPNACLVSPKAKNLRFHSLQQVQQVPCLTREAFNLLTPVSLWYVTITLCESFWLLVIVDRREKQYWLCLSCHPSQSNNSILLLFLSKQLKWFSSAEEQTWQHYRSWHEMKQCKMANCINNNQKDK